MTAAAPCQADVFVLDTSPLLRFYLADGPMPPSLELAIQRGCTGDALLLVPDLCLLECASALLKQVQRHLLSADECRALLADLLQLPLRPPAPATLLLQPLIKPWHFHSACMTQATWLWRSGMALV